MPMIPRRALDCLLTLVFVSLPEFTVVGGEIQYPDTRRVDHVDTYHGVSVPDPYRWLEDLDGTDTKRWVDAQNEVTFGYLKGIAARDEIRQRITKLWDYEKFGMPAKYGDHYFFSKNDGLQNQYVLYVADSLEGEPRVLLDPNKWSADGTVALSGTYETDDGKLMAYSVSQAGSDWREIKVIDVETGKHLKDVVKWVKFSGASWSPDNKGFYYSRYDEPTGDQLEDINYHQKLYYHRLGTDQSQDELVYHRPDQKEWSFGGFVTDDGRYLIVSIGKGTEPKNRIYFRDLKKPGDEIKPLLDEFDAKYSFIDNEGPVFWFYTNKNAPRGRVIAVDTRNPAPANWEEIIPQAAETLRSANVLNDMFVASYLKDAHSQFKIFDLNGKFLRDVKLPGIGSAGGFGGKRNETETFYSFAGYTNPGAIYRYDMKTHKSTIYRRPSVDFDPSKFETKQVFFRSKDGTRIPMFITHKKGIKIDGKNPTYLYAYGGFNISVTPRFNVSNLVWMERGGVYAVANIRGGGEYGKDWHDAGRLKNKQNCFDDFVAAAKWLIDNKYTSSEKLAIGGGSNGGLLVGACITQRPDLFGAALPAVGVMDMLRFNKFTIGWAWESDYGSPQDPDMFKILHSYSPYHNIKKGTCYPATMVTTADHDDRVVPSHSFKFASAIQAAQSCDNPVLIRIETKAGHGAGKPTSKIIEEQADRWAFLLKALNVDSSVSNEPGGGAVRRGKSSTR